VRADSEAMNAHDSAAEHERDALRLAARALGEFATGPARARHELFAELLGELCAQLGASAGIAAERVAPARGTGGLRVLAVAGGAAGHCARGDELPRSRAALERALTTLAPAHEPADAEAAALLALPLCARGELLGAIALERSAGEFTASDGEALEPFAAACGELLLGYARAGLRARAEDDLVRAQRHLWRSAALDGLTGLANRVSSQRALEDAAARSHSAGLPLAVIALDIDDAKQLADRIGAAAFDEALARAARTLHETLRPADWRGRWGIDSFVVTLLGCDADAAAVVAERIRLRIEGASFAVWGGAEIALTVSAGVAGTGLAREAGAEITARALRALDEAKRAGRNRVCVSRPARA
jgi:diguanylate cyclase (GGDEF)-like protein